MPRRSGSPLKGAGIVLAKELSDHLRSARMLVLQWLILLTGIGAVFTSIQTLKSTTDSDPFLFLRLFTDARDPLPSFLAVLTFLIPLMAIGLTFDSVNGEFNRRTLSRILSQPIYRDALLVGKFAAALTTLAVALGTLWLLVIGLGLVRLGIPPSGEEVARSIAFLIAGLAYGAVWLAIAMLCSVVCRSPATAALSALGAWLMLSLLWPLLAQFVAGLIYPPNAAQLLFGLPNPQQLGLQEILSRISPGTLFAESVVGILHPATNTFGIVLPNQIDGAVQGAPLSFGQSLLLVWPQLTGLVAGAILLFSVAYVAFQRQEVRA